MQQMPLSACWKNGGQDLFNFELTWVLLAQAIVFSRSCKKLGIGLYKVWEEVWGPVPHGVLLVPGHVDRGRPGELCWEEGLYSVGYGVGGVKEIVHLLDGWARYGLLMVTPFAENGRTGH